jgi:hypothetical protein
VRTSLAYVPPFGDPRAAARHLVRQVVLSMAEPRPDLPHGPLGRLAWNVLRPALLFVLPSMEGLESWELAERLVEDERRLEAVWARSSAPRALVQRLAHAVLRLVPSGDEDVLRALFLMLHPEHRHAAVRWLAGVDLSLGDLRRLGVRSSRLSEDAAFEALQQLGLLARAFDRPITLCFDQTESLPDAGSLTGIRALFRLLRRVHDLCPGFLLIVTCLNDKWGEFQEQLHQSEHHPLSRNAVFLEPMPIDVGIELVAQRMAQACGDLRPPYPTYPFREPELRNLLMFGITPRDLISFCGEWIGKMRHGRVVFEVFGPEQDKTLQVPTVEDFEQLWLQKVQRMRRLPAQTLDRVDEALLGHVLGEALSAVADEEQEGLDAALEPDLRLFELLWVDRSIRGDLGPFIHHEDATGRWTAGVCVAETENGTTFAHLLNRLLDRLRLGGGPNGLFLLRQRPIPQGWKIGRSLLQQMRRLGGTLVRLEQPDLEGLLAYSELLAEAAAGDLVIKSIELTPADVRRFVRQLGKLAELDVVRRLLSDPRPRPRAAAGHDARQDEADDAVELAEQREDDRQSPTPV